LYNLESDIQELNDISSQNPEIVKEIELIFKNEHEMAEMEKFRMKALDK
jgi:arylsulfatase